MSNIVTQTRITKQEFIAKERAIAEILQPMNAPQLLAVMGVTNAYCWAALERASAVKEGRIDQSKVSEIIAASKEGAISIEVANLWLCDYLKKQWPGACNSDYSCRQVRQMLSDAVWKTRTDDEGEIHQINGLGLLHFTPKLSGTTVIPPTLERLDIPGMAMLYRCAFRLWREKMYRKFPDVSPFDLLPDHKGMFMVSLFDSIFMGMVQFSTDGFERAAIEFTAMPVVQGVKQFVMWFWSESHKLCRRGWRKLMRREVEMRERQYQDELTDMGVAY